MARSRVVVEQLLVLARTVLQGSTGASKRYHPVVGRTLGHMAENFRDETSLEKLGGPARASPSHLGRLFREEIGLSPMQFLTLLRVENAKRLLADRHLSVTEAGSASGFPDLRSFERAFKRWIGCAPKEYQKKALTRPKSL